MTKICKSCNIELTEKNAAKKNAKYYRNICKPCNSKRASDYQKKNPEKRRTYINDYVRRIGKVKEYPCEQCETPCYKKYEKAFCSDPCRFLSYVDMSENTKECWLWTGSVRRGGYGGSSFKGKVISSHRLSYILFKGEIPEGKLVCHTCDNPPCVKPSHLWIGTVKDNSIDMVTKGRSLHGEAHKKSKIKNEDVVNIRKMNIDGIAQNEIALQYGLTAGHVNNIVKKRAWKKV